MRLGNAQDNCTSGNALYIANCNLERYRKVFANFAKGKGNIPLSEYSLMYFYR